MRKVTILGCLLVLVAGSAAVATDTRVLTLGENNMILLDEANISLFPSRLFDYPNLAVGEFGRIQQIAPGEVTADEDPALYPEFKQLGVHWKFGSDKPWVLGTYFHNSEFMFPLNFKGQPSILDALSFFENRYGYEALVVADTLRSARYLLWRYPDDFQGEAADVWSNQRLDLYLSRQLAKNNIGFHFGRVYSSWKMDAENNETEKSFTVYSFDAGMTMKNGLFDWSVGLDLSSFTDKNGDGKELTKPTGGAAFNLKARYFHSFNPTYTMIPHISFSTGKLGAKYYADEDGDIVLQETDEYSSTLFDLGVGLQGTPANNVLLVLDFGLTFDKVKGTFEPNGGESEEATVTTNSVPYVKLGLDADVFKWLDVRFGARTFCDHRTFKYDNGDKEKWNYADDQTYLGFGFHFNRLHIDTRTDPNLFLKGLNFISGEDTEMNWQLSAAYEF